MVKKIILSFIFTALIFAVIFFGRGMITSAFADVTLEFFGENNSDVDIRALAEKYQREIIKNEKNRFLETENQKLKALLSIKSDMDINTVAAKVVSFGNNTDYRYLFADCGSLDGVYPGSCVISESGYVGEVYECGENWCGIKTTESGDTEISVTCLGNGKTYLLSGENKRMEFVSSSDDVSPGDVIVTSGLSYTIPKGLKVGRIMKTEKLSSAEVNVTVSCFEDYQNLSYVLICRR